jgi:hypothetical protein
MEWREQYCDLMKTFSQIYSEAIETGVLFVKPLCHLYDRLSPSEVPVYDRLSPSRVVSRSHHVAVYDRLSPSRVVSRSHHVDSALDPSSSSSEGLDPDLQQARVF